jgi:hypothetical protein
VNLFQLGAWPQLSTSTATETEEEETSTSFCP